MCHEANRDFGPSTDRRAFTLIELLVVIAIIALLVSILLPSLRKAKDQAESAVCASNLRSIHTASSIYASENRSWLPAAYAHYWRDYRPMSAYIHINQRPHLWPGVLARGGYMGSSGMTADLMRSYSCPTFLRFADPKDKVNADGTVKEDWPIWITNGYGMTTLYVDSRRLYPEDTELKFDWRCLLYNIDRVPRPGRTLMIEDRFKHTPFEQKSLSYKNIYQNEALLHHYIWPFNGSWRDGVLPGPHNERSNYAFYDGHVTAMTYEEVMDGGFDRATRPR